MTLLAVDIGNSQTVLATFDGDQRVGCWRVTTASRATADELRLLWRGVLRDAEITGVSACSTVPALLPALRELLDSLEVPVVLIGPGVRTGVPLHVYNPREVGSDRVVTAMVNMNRNDTVARFAGHLLRRYVDPLVVLELLLAWNAMRCKPPLARDEG